MAIAKITIGNDIPLQWSVKRGGSALNLSNYPNRKLYLVSPAAKFKADFSVTGDSHNVVSLTFRGADQKYCGSYHLELVLNDGLDSMATIVSDDCIMLVPDNIASQPSSTPLPTVTLVTDILLPGNGFSAYQIAVIHGYEGTEAEWIAEYNAAVQAALDAAEEAEEAAETCSNTNTTVAAAEVIRQSNESTRQSQESTRVSQESTRQSQESTRQSNESTRQSQEGTRGSNESTRLSNEQTRVSQESSRVSAESTRESNESYRAEQESTRQSNESTRQSKEAGRQSQEGIRQSQENTRQSNEQTRQGNEQSRQTTFATNEGQSSDAASSTGSRWARFKQSEADRAATFESTEAARESATATIQQEAEHLAELDSKVGNIENCGLVVVEGLLCHQYIV